MELVAKGAGLPYVKATVSFPITITGQPWKLMWQAFIVIHKAQTQEDRA